MKLITAIFTIVLFCLFYSFVFAVDTTAVNMNFQFPTVTGTVSSGYISNTMTAVNRTELYTTNYTVPSGYDLYITNVLVPTKTSYYLSITPEDTTVAVTILTGNVNSAKYGEKTNVLSYPLFLGDGDTLAASDDKVSINGFLVAESDYCTMVSQSKLYGNLDNPTPSQIRNDTFVRNEYTVPTGSALAIGNVYMPSTDNLKVIPGYKYDTPDSSTEAADLTSSSGSSISAGTYYYVFTAYSTLTGLTSNSSSAITASNITADSSIYIQNIDTDVSSGNNAIKIWRTTHLDNSVYYYVGTLLISSDTHCYTDSISNANLGDKLDTSLTEVNIADRYFNYSVQNSSNNLILPIFANAGDKIWATSNKVSFNGYLLKQD